MCRFTAPLLLRPLEATHALHRLQLEVRPHIAEFMEREGRGREIAAARVHKALSVAGRV